MASLLSKLFNYAASTPITTVAPLDDDQNQLVGVNGAFNGGSTDKKLLTRSSDASDPPYDLDQLGAGPLARWKQAGGEKVSIANSGQFVSAVATGTAPFSLASTTMNPNLNADTVDGIQGANIAKLDTHKTAWSVSWFFPAIPSAVEAVESVGRFIVPSGTEIKIVLFGGVWAGGSDSGASNIFTIARRNSAGAFQANIGTVDVNALTQNVIGSAGVDVTLSAGDQIFPILQTRNAPASETLISIFIHGTQKFRT